MDPAHLIPRSLGGCGDPLCVVPLCRRRCHRAYDSGELDLLPYLEPAWRAQLAHAVGHVGLIGALRRISGDAATLNGSPGQPTSASTRALKLMGQQRLERRPAARALARAPLGPMNPARGDRDRIRRQPARHAVAVRAVSDAVDDHGVDVEPEAEREHAGDGSAARRGVNRSDGRLATRRARTAKRAGRRSR